MTDTVEGTLPVGDTGAFLATTVVTNTDGVEVHREEVVVTDPSNLDARQAVLFIDGQYRALVSDAGTGRVRGTLEAIYDQNERILMFLESISNP